MALEFINEREAEQRYESILTNWARSYGYKGCHSAGRTKMMLKDTEWWARNSKTAQKVLQLVKGSAKKITVVGMRGGYQCFDSDGMIFIDIDGQLTVNVRGPHDLHLDPRVISGRRNVVELNNRLAILHEFGHAKQWIETPAMFDNKQGDYDARLDKTKFAQDIRAAAEKRLKKTGDESVLPAKETVSSIAWSVKIELDNMSRHEWPICKELGLPMRANYRDINSRSAAVESTTSSIQAKLRVQFERERQAALAKQREAEAIIKRGKKQKVCPHCHEEYSGMYMLHKMDYKGNIPHPN